MATERFARIDDNNVVQEIMLIDSNDYDGDTEQNGAKRCAVISGFPIENFKKCNFGGEEASGVASYRGVTPAVGVTVWDETNQLFREPSAPYPSWTLNTSTGSYDPPVARVPKADDGVDATFEIRQYWDEASQSWKLDDYTPVGNIIEI